MRDSLVLNSYGAIEAHETPLEAAASLILENNRARLAEYNRIREEFETMKWAMVMDIQSNCLCREQCKALRDESFQAEIAKLKVEAC